MSDFLNDMSATGIKGMVPQQDFPILEKMREWGLPTRKWHEMMAEYSPDTLEDWFAARRKLSENSVLEPKVQEFLIIAIDAVAHWPHIKNHINRAFDRGATIAELVEVSIVAGQFMGPHAWGYGLSAVADVIESRKADGKPCPEGIKKAATGSAI